jgi:hypothetical protein
MNGNGVPPIRRVFACDALRLRDALDGAVPSYEEKVVTTKRAPIGLKEPVKSSLHGVSGTHTAKLDGFTMWTALRE